jgi:hypothetical protein
MINIQLIFNDVGEIIDFTEYFKQQFEIYEKDKKKVESKLKILLCGSYFPDSEYKRLIKIRDELRNKGWKQTNLVKDFRYKTSKRRHLVTFRERSFNAIDIANVVFFIYTKGGQSNGRGMELEHVLSNNFLLWKTILIFEEEPDGNLYGSELVIDELKKLKKDVRVSTVPINDDNALLAIIESHLIDFLEGLPRTIPKDSSV